MLLKQIAKIICMVSVIFGAWPWLVSQAQEPFVVTGTVPMGQGGLLVRNQYPEVTFNQPVNVNLVNQNIFIWGEQTGFYTKTTLGNVLNNDTLVGLEIKKAFKPGENIMIDFSSGIQSNFGTSLKPYIWQLRAATLGGGDLTESGQKVALNNGWAVALGDVNNDDDLDALVGTDRGNQLYLNFEATGQFFPTQLLGPQSNADVAMADFNHDGLLDVVVTDLVAGDKIWLNISGAQGISFTLAQTLTRSGGHKVAVGDVEGDGDLDLLIANGSNESWLRGWLNNGQGNFTYASELAIEGDSVGLEMVDVDNDGDLDALSGTSSGKLQLYVNDGAGDFLPKITSITPMYRLVVGDLDLDGDLDLFMLAVDGTAQVWFNDGQGNFSQGLKNPLLLLGGDMVALADFDGDDDLDALVGGKPNRLWLNDGAGYFILAQSDLPDNGRDLTTDMALGDMNGDGTVDVFMVGTGDNYTPPVWFNRKQATGVFAASGEPLGNENTESTALRDLDGDGDLDVFVANRSRVGTRQNGPGNEVWLNDGHGHYTDTGQILAHLDSNAAALGDVDGDGDADAVVGNDNNAGNQVWLNDGTGKFNNSGQTLGQGSTQAVALGDVDGDDDLDTVIGNSNNEGNQIWLNDGTGIFTQTAQSLGQADTQAISLGDVDNDGDLDTVVGNSNNEGNQIWLNDGTGIFTNTAQTLGQTDAQAVALADVDNDGDLDTVIGNSNNQGNQVWLNDGTGKFSQSATGLGQADTQAVSLADFDQDGDLDAVVGNSNNSQIWLNDGTGKFSDSGQTLSNGDSQAVSLGDVDQDGDTDIFVGHNGPNEVFFNKNNRRETYLPVIRK